LSRRRLRLPIPEGTSLYARALNLPMLVAMLVMMTAFGRLHLWLPLCFGKACESAANGPSLVPLAASILALCLLSRKQIEGSWQATHWDYHQRTIMMGALAATTLLLAMVLTGDVPLALVAGITMQVVPPSFFYLISLSGLTIWVLARCLVSAHAASACRPLLSTRTYLW
jgi:hypothetical protein